MSSIFLSLSWRVGEVSGRRSAPGLTAIMCFRMVFVLACLLTPALTTKQKDHGMRSATFLSPYTILSVPAFVLPPTSLSSQIFSARFGRALLPTRLAPTFVPNFVTNTSYRILLELPGTCEWKEKYPAGFFCLVVNASRFLCRGPFGERWLRPRERVKRRAMLG
jgi:hypothetical protein